MLRSVRSSDSGSLAARVSAWGIGSNLEAAFEPKFLEHLDWVGPAPTSS